MKHVSIWLSDEVYLELVKRYGVRGISKAVDDILRKALLGGEK